MREDRTEDALEYLGQRTRLEGRLRLGKTITETERKLLAKLPDELSLSDDGVRGVSGALKYGRAIRPFAYSKREREALHKLLLRKELAVERESSTGLDFLVKASKENPLAEDTENYWGDQAKRAEELAEWSGERAKVSSSAGSRLRNLDDKRFWSQRARYFRANEARAAAARLPGADPIHAPDMITRFRDLKVGDTFDFIPDDEAKRAGYPWPTSFLKRCRKVSATRYTYDGSPKSGNRVGKTSVRVFHVEHGNPTEDAPWKTHHAMMRAKRIGSSSFMATLKKSGTVIYPRLLAIMAEKRDGKRYKHELESSVPVLGLPDGSLLIPARGRRLWGTV
jgi:hypothetical protein